MSASDKKKLRKEQQNAAVTEKQLSEQKKQKKQKAYTITFVVAMVLVVAIVLVSVLSTPITNMMIRNTTALTVNDHELSAVEFNYYYMDYISNFYNEFSSAGDYQDMYVMYYTGLNPGKALDEQTFNSTTKETWADYFIDCAISSAKWSYTMYDAAVKAGHTLSESEKTSLTNLEKTYQTYATYLGYGSADNYLKALYGSSATMESYQSYCEIKTLASSYANAYIDGLEYTDEDFREYESEKKEQYNSYSYAYYYVKASDYLTGGTTVKGEDGKTTVTYSDEEKQAAVDAALKDAQALAVESNNDVEKLNLAIGKLESSSTTKTASEYPAVLYSSLPTLEGMAEWLSDSERKAGDITYIASTTHTHAEGEEHSDDEDESKYETVNGYYVVLYLDTIDNTMNIGTVRHLLVQWELDKDAKEPTEEQKKAALKEAEDLLAQYKAGKMTEEAFIELVKKNSDDSSKTSGGLISNIHPDAGYVDSFTDWATAEHKAGDVDIIESEYGYHIMYYVEAAELNYRDTLINADMVDEAYAEWEEAVLKDASSKEIDMKYVDTDLVISG